jgi:hypothetical protein
MDNLEKQIENIVGSMFSILTLINFTELLFIYHWFKIVKILVQLKIVPTNLDLNIFMLM